MAAQGACWRWAAVYAPVGPGREPLVWASSRMAVVRAKDPRYADRDPGKWISDEGKATVPHNGREVTLREGAFFLITTPVILSMGSENPI